MLTRCVTRFQNPDQMVKVVKLKMPTEDLWNTYVSQNKIYKPKSHINPMQTNMKPTNTYMQLANTFHNTHNIIHPTR